MIKLPRIVGHRGACGYAPENTLESIRTAAEMGVAWVELDVKLSRDGVPVIFHDDTLDRTTNGSGPIAARDWMDLQELDAGSWFADSFAGIKIPSLEETLEVLIDTGLGLNLEIKPCAGREVETASVALDMLSRIWDEHDKLLISSFQAVCLETAQELTPDWYRGLLLWHDDMPDDWQALVEYLDVAAVNISDQLADRAFIEEIMELRKAVGVYTINDGQRARKLVRFGADALFSDMPDVIQEALPKVH